MTTETPTATDNVGRLIAGIARLESMSREELIGVLLRRVANDETERAALRFRDVRRTYGLSLEDANELAGTAMREPAGTWKEWRKAARAEASDADDE